MLPRPTKTFSHQKKVHMYHANCFFKNGSGTVWFLTIVSHGLSLQFESIWYILFKINFSFCLYSKVYLPFPLKTMEPDHYPRTPRCRPVSQNVPTPYLSVSLLSFMVSAPQLEQIVCICFHSGLSHPSLLSQLRLPVFNKDMNHLSRLFCLSFSYLSSIMTWILLAVSFVSASAICLQ